MTSTASLHSRSILAGYDPEYVQTGKVLVVGLGALGQNLVQNLALLGVGQLMLVDFDVFEGHNATRSPFYPTHSEVTRLGNGKAAVVAHRAAQASTAPKTDVFYSALPIQLLGDGALSWADIVVAAVDSMNARAWLSERCRLLARPMVEGGFSGPDFNLSAFAPTKGAVCYRCGRPGRESSMSCTAYALAAEQARIIPAIQTSAAVLGGYQAEQVVQLLHGRLNRLGYRSYGNVRRETLQTALLSVDDRCPGKHLPEPVIGIIRDLPSTSTLSDLIAAISDQFGSGRIELAEHAIATINCTRCLTSCLVQGTESRWLSDPRCLNCGGPWPKTKAFTPDIGKEFDTEDQLTDELGSIPLNNLGVLAGASLAVQFWDGRSGLVRTGGDILSQVERATPFDLTATDL
jgi:molybdopterin/thiamine biosynthesis adenylyltransferase